LEADAANAKAILPPSLARIIRPELPDLAEEIIAEIRAAIPAYARPVNGPYGEALRRGVLQALTTFVDLVVDPSAARGERDEVCRRLGRFEALEGRSMDDLQAAYRIGAQVAWRRLVRMDRHAGFSPAIVSSLADAAFRYIDELVALSLAGYQEAKSRSGPALQKLRQRLLRLILEQPPVPRRAIAGLARQARWAIPDSVTPVAVPTGNEADTSVLDDDVLADLTCAEPHLLIPGEVTDSRQRMLRTVMAGRVAIGVTVPLPAAADSLRWARRALGFAETGLISDTPDVRCDDHLVTLWLLSDRALADEIVRRQLGLLERLTPLQRRRYSETLAVWVQTRCTVAEIAQMLHVHPQTIRYRIRQFEQAFGDRLKDPEARFGLELALRIMRLDQRISRQRSRIEMT
jgi:hypothetical protein